MAEQPDLFSAPQSPRQQADARPRPARPGRVASPWMMRAELAVRVIVRIYLGLLLLVLPWSVFWTDNSLFTYSPVLLAIEGSGFARGVVSGLGVLNVVLALAYLRVSRKRS